VGRPAVALLAARRARGLAAVTDPRSRQILELPLIVERLAALTAFSPSRRLAERLEPSSDPIVVRRWLDETDEARAFLADRPDTGIGGARDIEPHIRRAERGGRLSGAELLEVLETLVAAGALVDALRNERRPLLHALSRRIQPLPAVRNRLQSSVDPAGELLDSASPALGGLRRQVRVSYERLRGRLEQMVHGSELAGVLQDPIVTLRNGRYVIPVRADAKGRVKGIVHDQSASGQTLFVEPLAVMELGNSWREAQLAVQHEEERILDELSALVASQADSLAETLSAMASFDLWSARASLAEQMDGVRAAESTDGQVELLSARHPGLTGTVVPIDIRVGGEYRALVITGPNTGGKTVTLRTLGLLALMNQAGLHVPAASGSRLPIFGDVFADIGDEQSIAQSLSTFSGHMRAIVRIVEAAGPADLVLLDELGAGTDPTEGSALAQALLDHFIGAGAIVAATTHYAELKTYAYNEPRARNASVDFDLETLSPTYHLSIGLPGTSHAFAIAQRLGMPGRVIDDARARVGRAEAEFEQTLASIRQAQHTADEALAQATAAQERARQARSAAEEERRQARAQSAVAMEEARRAAEQALEEVRAEIHAARQALARETLTEQLLDHTLTALEARIAPHLPSREDEAASEPSAAAPGIAVGATVRTPDGWQGRIVELDRDGTRATLVAGSMRLEVPLAGLAIVTGQAAEPRDDPLAAPAPRPQAGVPSTLDVRGARVDDATALLDQHLDRAAVAGASRLTVIHGHGSGALRDALRKLLSGHPLVRSWRPGERGEGGDGATIVEL
jgi:DNA mismatch repair protein MutS2